jgi:sortase B
MKNKKIILIFIAAAIFILAAVCVYIFYPEYKESDDYNKKIKYFEEISPDNPNNNYDDKNAGLLDDLKNINSDICAWITIPDTNIDFPIVQCEDNEYYLSHDIEKNYSYMGVPFLDYRNNSDFSDFNSIIYGHNIKNRRMFSDINKFKTQEFFDTHTVGYLTLNDRKHTINFIACDVVESTSFAYTTVFLSDDEKDNFIENIRKNAVCMRNFDDLKNKNLCTLSTCSYEFDNARTVLIGYID